MGLVVISFGIRFSGFGFPGWRLHLCRIPGGRALSFPTPLPIGIFGYV